MNSYAVSGWVTVVLGFWLINSLVNRVTHVWHWSVAVVGRSASMRVGILMLRFRSVEGRRLISQAAVGIAALPVLLLVATSTRYWWMPPILIALLYGCLYSAWGEFIPPSCIVLCQGANQDLRQKVSRAVFPLRIASMTVLRSDEPVRRFGGIVREADFRSDDPAWEDIAFRLMDACPWIVFDARTWTPHLQREFDYVLAFGDGKRTLFLVEDGDVLQRFLGERPNPIPSDRIVNEDSLLQTLEHWVDDYGREHGMNRRLA